MNDTTDTKTVTRTICGDDMASMYMAYVVYYLGYSEIPHMTPACGLDGAIKLSLGDDVDMVFLIGHTLSKKQHERVAKSKVKYLVSMNTEEAMDELLSKLTTTHHDIRCIAPARDDKGHICQLVFNVEKGIHTTQTFSIDDSLSGFVSLLDTDRNDDLGSIYPYISRCKGHHDDHGVGAATAMEDVYNGVVLRIKDKVSEQTRMCVAMAFFEAMETFITLSRSTDPTEFTARQIEGRLHSPDWTQLLLLGLVDSIRGSYKKQLDLTTPEFNGINALLSPESLTIDNYNSNQFYDMVEAMILALTNNCTTPVERRISTVMVGASRVSTFNTPPSPGVVSMILDTLAFSDIAILKKGDNIIDLVASKRLSDIDLDKMGLDHHSIGDRHTVRFTLPQFDHGQDDAHQLFMSQLMAGLSNVLT